MKYPLRAYIEGYGALALIFAAYGLLQYLGN